MKKFFPLWAALSCLVACNGLPGKSTGEAAIKQSSSPIQSSNAQQDSPPQSFEAEDSIHKMPVAKPAEIDWDKKIIKNATIELEVDDFKKYNDRLYQTVKKFGAYIASEDQDFSALKKASNVEIKVPVAQFESLMNELPGDDTRILERKINSEDVTGAVFDTRARLEAKKEVRTKYLEFLRQSKNMKDMLAVQLEINSIQEQIEAAGTRVNYLNHQAAMSTINLQFTQLLTAVEQGPSRDRGFLRRIGTAFRAGAHWMADLVVALMSIWPLLLLLTVGGILLRRNLAKKSTPALQHNSRR